MMIVKPSKSISTITKIGRIFLKSSLSSEDVLFGFESDMNHFSCQGHNKVEASAQPAAKPRLPKFDRYHSTPRSRFFQALHNIRRKVSQELLGDADRLTGR